MIMRIMTISRVCHPLGFPGSILRKLQFFRKTQNDPQVISGSNALSINTVESCSLLLTHYFCQSTSQFTCFQRFEPGFTVFASSAPRFRVLYLSLFSHWGFGSSWPFLFTLQLFWLCLQMSSANRFGYGHSLSLSFVERRKLCAITLVTRIFLTAIKVIKRLSILFSVVTKISFDYWKRLLLRRWVFWHGEE